MFAVRHDLSLNEGPVKPVTRKPLQRGPSWSRGPRGADAWRGGPETAALGCGNYCLRLSLETYILDWFTNVSYMTHQRSLIYIWHQHSLIYIWHTNTVSYIYMTHQRSLIYIWHTNAVSYIYDTPTQSHIYTTHQHSLIYIWHTNTVSYIWHTNTVSNIYDTPTQSHIYIYDTPTQSHIYETPTQSHIYMTHPHSLTLSLSDLPQLFQRQQPCVKGCPCLCVFSRRSGL